MKNKIVSKYIAFLLSVIMLLSIVSTTAGGIITSRYGEVEDKVTQQNPEDERIAQELSNMSGVEAQEIQKLKDQGKSWNEITELLKTSNLLEMQGSVERSNLLAKNGLDDEIVQKLQKEGFSVEKITEAKMLIERVIYKLEEITGVMEQDMKIPESVTPGIETKTDGDDKETYRELANKININTAVMLVLKLEKDFGSMEKVLDEYLFALQVGLNLEDYLNNKQSYERARNDKTAELDYQKIITLSNIEEKLLEKIQSENANINKPDDIAAPSLTNQTKDDVIENNKYDDLMPGVGPKIEDISPTKPGEDVYKEINEIKNNSLGIPRINEGGIQ